MAHMQWPGGIGRDELHLDPPTGPHLAAPIGVPGGQDLRDQRQVGPGGKVEIDKAGPGDLGPRQDRRGGQFGDDTLGQVPRLAAGQPGQDHGRVAGEIAVSWIPGALDLRVLDGGLSRRIRGEHASVCEPRQRCGEEGLDLLLHRDGAASQGRGSVAPGRRPRL